MKLLVRGVAGAAGVTDPNGEHEKDTVTAVALVVIFGTLMIPLMPFLTGLMGMDGETASTLPMLSSRTRTDNLST